MKNIFIYFSILSACLFAFNTVDAGQSVALKENIIERIDLINKIIKDPKEACMKNWIVLGNPHDETELQFYSNSISDGTKTVYDKKSTVYEKLLRHSQSKSEDELSIVLQYLRLSLMAYDVRPGSEPPSFKFNSYSQNQNTVIADCVFSFNNAAGKTIHKQSKIIFEIGDNIEKDLSLTSISIEDHVVYGWWY